MKTIQVFDPALCCSTGVCGVDIDQQLVDFSADVEWAKQNGAQIERFNLAQQPLAFAENPLVKSFLEHSGSDALPLIVVDGAIRLAGRYPNRDELSQWAGLDITSANTLTPQIEEMIALGAAVAASCEPCFKFHYDKARKLGVTPEAMQEAVAIGDMVKQASAQNMLELAGRLLNKSSDAKTGSACCGGSSAVKDAEKSSCCG
jgi:AhpD family alkylhydroperoxidase